METRSIALRAAWCVPCLLLVAAAQLLPQDTPRLLATVGGYAVMNCHLDFPFGTEIPYHLQWDKDGELIYSWYGGRGGGGAGGAAADRYGGRVLRPDEPGLGGGAINLTAVRETDAGLYRCRVSFPNRTPAQRNNGTYYYLDVDGSSLIVTPPTNVTVLEGDRAELTCGVRPGAAREWLRDGEPLSALPELAARADLPANGSLVLRRTAAADRALYTCRVADDTHAQSSSAFLDVHYKAKVVWAPSTLFFPLGKPASLDCHFSANPPLTNLRWEKDGFLFDPYNVQGVFYGINGSLLFHRVNESHEGVYSCTAYNALGTAGAGARVSVRVLRPPALQLAPRPLYLARRGAALTLPCAPAASAQPADLVWTRKDGTPLPEGRYYLDEGNLTLTDIEEGDRGVYVCSVTNEAATVSAETELLLENVPPRPPHSLSAAVDGTTVHVSWLPDDDTGAEGEAGAEGEPDATESAWAAAAGPVGDNDHEPLEVTVRLLEEGALIRWGPETRGERCEVLWVRHIDGAEFTLQTFPTQQDHLLIPASEVVPGVQYTARVSCAGGARGSAQARAAAGAGLALGAGAAVALLLAAAGAATYALRHRLCTQR